MPKLDWKPVRSIQECETILTGPGQFHELEHAIIDGAVYRVYKNVWPSLRDFWLSSVSNNPSVRARDYLVFEETRITYGQADELVQRAASVFRELYGVRKGDRVGIAMRNYPEWVISFFAAGLLGAIPTLFNAWLPIEPFVHCINTTTPKILIVDPERLSLLTPQLRTLRLHVIIVRPTPTDLKAGPDVKVWPEVLSSYSGSLKAWEMEPNPLPDDDATMFFTSGTTGLPKAVLSTQRGFLGNYFNATYAARRRELRIGQDFPPPIGQGPVPEVEPEQVSSLIAVPLFHVTGCTGQLIVGTAHGSKIVFMRKWDKEEAARLIAEEKISSFAGVPSLLYDLMDSSLVGNKEFTGVGIGGAPAADTFVGEMVKKFPNVVVQQGYGLSETNSLAVSIFGEYAATFSLYTESSAIIMLVSYYCKGEDFLARPDSTGLPLGVVDLLVVDPNTNKVLSRGQVGELWIRGPNVMRGYYNSPEATADAITRDGWFKSGDLASIDEEGFVYIKDRVKDMIIRGGENIHSAVVENALFSDDRILDCAAVGVPDRRLGELVGAAVVPRNEWIGKLNENDVLQKVKGRLPAFAVPSIIVVRDEHLERNAAGKVLKKELRKTITQAWEQRTNLKGKL